MTGGAGHGVIDAKCLTEYSGYYAQRHNGLICQLVMAITRRCIEGFRSGGNREAFEELLVALGEDLRERGKLNLKECFIDGTFVPAKKGGLKVGPTKRGKGTKFMAIVDSNGLPVAGRIASASPSEVRLVESTLQNTWAPSMPERLIGDKAYDRDPLDKTLYEGWGVEMIAPNRLNRKRMTQDGRALRRYKRRWKVERLFAWLHNFRRLVVRWEYREDNFTAFMYLGCAIILLRYL